MSARIEKSFTFLAGVHFEGTYMMNLYNMELYIDIVTDSDKEQLTAIERIHYFLMNYVEHAIFVSEEHKSQISAYEKAGITVLALPEEPYDQIVGLILLRKLNAITEGRLHVDEIKFTSKLSADIKFHNFAEQAEEFDKVAWYNDSTLSIQDKTKKSKKDKIVKFEDLDDWNTVGLVWKS
jgi:hypothetical protein